MQQPLTPAVDKCWLLSQSCTEFLKVMSWFCILYEYNKFDKKKEKNVSLFCWGFLGENCCICIKFFMKDIQGICMEVQEGILYLTYPFYENKRSTIYSLTHTGENLITKIFI